MATSSPGAWSFAVRATARQRIICRGVRALALAVFAFALVPPRGCQQEESEATMDDDATANAMVNMTVVFDNNPGPQGLRTGWGFGCVVELPDTTVLFDTGADAGILLANMAVLGIDPSSVDLVVLSHIHGDHVGGLMGFLARNADVRVCVPPAFPPQFKSAITATGAELVEAQPGQELASHVYTTGQLGAGVKEQALIVDTQVGMVVITGCAHPGVVQMVAAAKHIRDVGVELVFGGFHLGGASRAQLEAILDGFRDLGVYRVGPCHCSGDQARAFFADRYGQAYVPVAVGTKIALPAVSDD